MMIPVDQAEHLGIWNQELLSFPGKLGHKHECRQKKKQANSSNTRKCTVNKIVLSSGLDSSSGQTYFTNRQVSYDSIFPKHTDQKQPDTQTLNSQRRVNICVHNSDHKLQTAISSNLMLHSPPLFSCLPQVCNGPLQLQIARPCVVMNVGLSQIGHRRAQRSFSTMTESQPGCWHHQWPWKINI